MSDSDLDKKRNKLGYQRISIACGKSDAPVPSPYRFAALEADLVESYTDQQQLTVVVGKLGVWWPREIHSQDARIAFG